MSKILATMLAIILWMQITEVTVFAQIKKDFYSGQEVVANQVIVRFKPSAIQSIEAIKQSLDIVVDEPVGGTGARKLKSLTKNVDELIRILKSRPDVMYVEPDYIVRSQQAPNDPDFSKLWGLQNTGQLVLGVQGTSGADISAVPAWSVTTGSNGVVGVIDTGVDYNHVDLKTNIWAAPVQFTVNIGGSAIDCAAGTHGFNAIRNNCDPLDDSATGLGAGHGTHVAGTIGAVGNNSIGVTGVDQFVKIMALKFLNKDGNGLTSDAINAIEFAVQAKAVLGDDAPISVLSNSWGCQGCFSQTLLDEINRAGSSNMLFVAAAGNLASDNDSTPFYPASYAATNIISVAATDNKDTLASFSDFGASSVALAAPGNNIFSTIPGDSYGYKSGTSMATPHVSGAAALIMNKCPALGVLFTISEITTFVDQLSSLSGKVSSGGRLNVKKVLDDCAFSHGGPFCPRGPNCVETCVPKCEAENGQDCQASCECCCTKARKICFQPK